MKILSNKKWLSINNQIKDLRKQVSDLASEVISKEDLLKGYKKENSKILIDNRKLGQDITDLEVKFDIEVEKVKNLKKDNKLLKTLCTKNNIDYNEVLMKKPKDKDLK